MRVQPQRGARAATFAGSGLHCRVCCTRSLVRTGKLCRGPTVGETAGVYPHRKRRLEPRTRATGALRQPEQAHGGDHTPTGGRRLRVHRLPSDRPHQPRLRVHRQRHQERDRRSGSIPSRAYICSRCSPISWWKLPRPMMAASSVTGRFGSLGDLIFSILPLLLTVGIATLMTRKAMGANKMRTGHAFRLRRPDKQSGKFRTDPPPTFPVRGGGGG